MPKRSMKTGDIVLICESKSPRNQWPLALVTEVIPRQDNLVCKVKIITSRAEKENSLEADTQASVTLTKRGQ